MRRLWVAIGWAGLGALLALAYVAGGTRATRPPDPPLRPSTETVDLDGYCRRSWGPAASGYLSTQPHRVQCTAVRNGVWGFEPVNLDEACRWQRGPNAHFELRQGEVIDSRTRAVSWKVLCVG